eukprot:TRINITY_DN790_c1_g1_i1.p1 TRINITY_DN790_c1_g1~~TRINITY_DN790_c1_g1_i1.p1  ORF type:complete len:379 (-),score=77.46 TRINITY_DN790_c1_g1_i1:82-1152(-)
MDSFAQVATRKGFSLTRTKPETWCTGVKDATGLLSVVLGHEALSSLLGRHHTYKQDNIDEACEHFGISYPRMGEKTMSGYLDRLMSEQLLPMAPSGGLKLNGRVALVTGASSGIGRAIARSLAAEGATVVLVARNVEKLQAISAQLPGSSYVKCDVTSRSAVHSMIEEVASKLGRIDILVNSAGVMYFTLMKNVHYHEWEETVDVNCKGVMNVCGAALPLMLKEGKGHIINISSDAAKTLFPALTVYNASKAFVRTFSKGLRAECVGTGLRVTDIQPGDTATNLVLRNTDQEAAAKIGIGIGKVVGEGTDRESFLDPEDVASAVLYATCSPEHVGVHELLIEPRDQKYGDPTTTGN